MKEWNCSEEQAYRQMRQKSMSNQMSLIKLAEQIIERS
ncbi:ANTAR domain-containing protein [Halalkalibacter alkalisediminis]